MRKLAAVLFLFVLAIAVWIGAQWFVHREDITATIVFIHSPKLKSGDPVREDDRTIGRVISSASLGDRTGVTIRLNRRDRRRIVTDSRFYVKDHALFVDNGIAVGTPIANGAILEAHEDRFAQWLSRYAAVAKPYIAEVRQRIDALSDHDFGEWTKNVPEWKKEGQEAYDRHVDEVQQKVAATVEELKKSGRLAEAQKLKERFEKWLKEIR
jgi:hypothetical protein